MPLYTDSIVTNTVTDLIEEELLKVFGYYTMKFNELDFKLSEYAVRVGITTKSIIQFKEKTHFATKLKKLKNKIGNESYEYLDDIRDSRNSIVHGFIEDPIDKMDASWEEQFMRLMMCLNILNFETDRIEDLLLRYCKYGKISFDDKFIQEDMYSKIGKEVLKKIKNEIK